MNHKRLPAEIQTLANRSGATDRVAFSSVNLTQRGEMRSVEHAGFRRFKARQTIDLRRPGFIWRAACGPFGTVSVVDSLSAGRGSLAVRALGVTFRRLADSGAVAKGEMMRYLAELAWAPDALLLNHALEWRMIDARTFAVGAGDGALRAEVVLRLNTDSLIGSIEAHNRPRYKHGRFVESPWIGRFYDYRVFEDRRIPTRAEVGWILEDREVLVWRGEITSWTLT